MRRAAIPAIVAALISSGCLTTFQTAKTVNGLALTGGVQLRPSYYGGTHQAFVLMPRVGFDARQDRPGVDLGVRLTVFPEKVRSSRHWPTWVGVSEDVKLQLPKNGFADIAFDAEFWLHYPVSGSVLLSKDLDSKLTLYGECELLGSLDIFSGDAVVKVTGGAEVNLSRHLSMLWEVEHWLSERDETPGIGIALGIH